MRFTNLRYLQPVLLSLIGGALLFYLARTGSSQPPAEKPAVGRTSYDQVGPALLGQITFDEMMAKDKAAKADVTARQKALLDERYDLSPHPDGKVKMTRGKPIPVGPTAKLANGLTFEKLAHMSAKDIRDKGLFPKGYLPLPHPFHATGGMVFPQQQIKQFAPWNGSISNSTSPNNSSPSFRQRFS